MSKQSNRLEYKGAKEEEEDDDDDEELEEVQPSLTQSDEWQTIRSQRTCGIEAKHIFVSLEPPKNLQENRWSKRNLLKSLSLSLSLS